MEVKTIMADTSQAKKYISDADQYVDTVVLNGAEGSKITSEYDNHTANLTLEELEVGDFQVDKLNVGGRDVWKLLCGLDKIFIDLQEGLDVENHQYDIQEIAVRLENLIKILKDAILYSMQADDEEESSDAGTSGEDDADEEEDASTSD